MLLIFYTYDCDVKNKYSKILNMKKNTFLLILTVLLITQGLSQNVTVTPATLNVTGGSGNTTNNRYHFEWSFGEATAIETMSSSNIKITYITNGILQPLSAIPILDDCWGPKEIKIYPNPTTGLIEIDFFSLLSGKVTLNLFDESGRLLEISEFEYNGLSFIKKMDLSRYPSSIYFLKIMLQPTGSTEIKKCTYKVVKFR